MEGSSASSRGATAEQAVRTELSGRLAARRTEIEQAVLTRINAVSEPNETSDPEYAESLRSALSAALDYSLVAIERGSEHPPPIPGALLKQARVAARTGVRLDTVLRRYFAGYTLLGDFLIEEAGGDGRLREADLKLLLRSQATLFDSLIATVTAEYTDEAGGKPDSVEGRRAESVKRLLAGELVETSDLAYEFDVQHIGAVAAGRGAAEALRLLATALDRRVLLIDREEGAVWAWLGGRRRVDPVGLRRAVASTWPARISLAIGEPGWGLTGWRLTHRQALAALPIALRSQDRFVHYGDVALLASILQDDLLATSLRQLYLAPLARERDGGETLRTTLRAYFAAECNTSSAAAALGVSRQTVVNRLRSIEERLARPIGPNASEIKAALQLDDVDEVSTPAGDIDHVANALV